MMQFPYSDSNCTECVKQADVFQIKNCETNNTFTYLIVLFAKTKGMYLTHPHI